MPAPLPACWATICCLAKKKTICCKKLAGSGPGVEGGGVFWRQAVFWMKGAPRNLGFLDFWIFEGFRVGGKSWIFEDSWISDPRHDLLEDLEDFGDHNGAIFAPKGESRCILI